MILLILGGLLALGFIFISAHTRIQFMSKLWLIYGKKGSGKSTLLAKIAHLMLKQGRPVYSTDPIKGTYPISSTDYFKYRYPKGSVVLIDEIGMVHDSRDFKKFESQARDWYKLQRHMGVMVVACSQTADVDKKVRDLADKVSIVRGVTKLLSVVRFYERRIVVARHGDGEGGQLKGSEIVDDVYPAGIWGGFVFTAGARYWKYFDSYAVPPWPPVEGWDGETEYPEPKPKKIRLVARIKGRISKSIAAMGRKQRQDTENISVEEEGS